MEQQPQCNQKQRDVFARMLIEARKRAEDELESDSDLDQRVKDELLPKLAQEYGALELIEKVRTLRRESEDAEKALDDLGFSCSEDRISLEWDAPKKLKQALEAAKRSARTERQRSLRKYDVAILGVWTAENVADARKIVESLL
jgi:hypothetical protein